MSDATLEVAGRFNNSGTITATNGTIVVNGTTVAQTIPANTFATNTIKSLTVANSAGVSLGGALSITGTYTPAAGTLSTGDYLTLKSTISGTANVAAGADAGGYISGNVTVERYLPFNIHRSWRLLAPITYGPQTINAAWQEGATSSSSNPNPGYGTIIGCNSNYSTAAGFDTVIPAMSILAFDVPSQSWTANTVTNTNVKSLSSEPGYFIYIRGDRSKMPSDTTNDVSATTLRSKGDLRQGTQPSISVPATKFALVSNPYASSIDFSAIAAGDKSNIDEFYYLWDPKLTGTYGLGGYVLFSSATSWTPSVTGGSYSAASSIIPSGMAFFVCAGASDGSLTLREGYKVSGNANTGFKATNNSVQKLHLQLSAVDNNNNVNPADGLFVVFGTDYSADIDGNDIGKPVNFGENLGIWRGDKVLALEARPTVAASDTIPLRMWKMKKSNYRISFEAQNFIADSQSVFLADRYLGKLQQISVTSPVNYDFIINNDTASYSQSRFYLVMKPYVVTPGTVLQLVDIYPNPVTQGHMTVRARDLKDKAITVAIYDNLGRKCISREMRPDNNNYTTTINRDNLPSGLYHVNISVENEVVKREKLIFQ